MKRRFLRMPRNTGKTAMMEASRDIREQARRGGRSWWGVYHVAKQHALVSGLYRLTPRHIDEGVTITWNPSAPHSTRVDERRESLGLKTPCFQIVGTDDHLIWNCEEPPDEDLLEGEHLFRLYTFRARNKGVTESFGGRRWVFYGYIYRPRPADMLDGLVAAELEGRTGALTLDELVLMPKERL